MSERDHYPTGVPCWVDILQRSPREAIDFYAALFGWTFVESAEADYFVARFRGRDVAGIGELPVASIERSAWRTSIRVDDADRTAEAASSAGGTVVEWPFNLGSAGRMAVLADPGGVPFCAWEPAGRAGAGVINEAGAWALSSLHSAEPERSSRFYGSLFGWEFTPYGPDGSGSALIRLAGYVGGVPNQPVPRDVIAVMAPTSANVTHAGRPGWSVDFWVDDPDAVAERATTLGGQLLTAPHDSSIFRTAVIADPWGAAFSISRLNA